MKNRFKYINTAIIAAMLMATASVCVAAEIDRKPNFIIIFIDDMGYGDIEPFGSKLNKAPNLNQMAAEGRKMTSFYVGSSVCTPSRAALMTGCYPQRVGLERGSGHIVLFPGDHHGLNRHPRKLDRRAGRLHPGLPERDSRTDIL